MEPGTTSDVPGGEPRSSVTQLRRGVLEYCVLALLRERPRYGFDVVKELSEQGGLLTSEGTIYPLLARLRKDGVVATSWQPSSSGPPRRYYEITPDGAAALNHFSSDWVRFRNAVDRVLGTSAGPEPVNGPSPQLASRTEV